MRHSSNKDIGAAGEKIALDHLLSKNYTLVTTNFQTRFGEIDLIMKDGETVVFVEVKTKKGLGFGPPEDMFTRGKYERVKRMATVYLGGREVPCRIDMVAVILDSSNNAISFKHYENAIPI